MSKVPCLADQREPRSRGPSVTERRATEDAAEAAKQEQKAAARARAVPGTAIVPAAVENAAGESRPMGARELGRGRAAMNAPVKLGGGVQNLEDRKASLMAKAEYRPTHKVTAVAPADTGSLDDLPDRMEFELATDAGAEQFAASMLEFIDKNVDKVGIEARSADAQELKAGFFGFWLEKRGHGKYVEWRKAENGWELHAITNEEGVPRVPTFAAVMDFALLVGVVHGSRVVGVGRRRRGRVCSG